jgi:hypothetical protein
MRMPAVKTIRSDPMMHETARVLRPMTRNNPQMTSVHGKATAIKLIDQYGTILYEARAPANSEGKGILLILAYIKIMPI